MEICTKYFKQNGIKDWGMYCLCNWMFQLQVSEANVLRDRYVVCKTDKYCKKNRNFSNATITNYFFKSQFISQITIYFSNHNFVSQITIFYQTLANMPLEARYPAQVMWCPHFQSLYSYQRFHYCAVLYSASIVQLFDPPQVSQTCPNWRLLPSFPSPSLSCSNHSYRLYSIELPSHPTATSLVSPPSLPPPSQIIMRHYTRPPTDYNALQ